jgi:hypothetical protein
VRHALVDAGARHRHREAGEPMTTALIVAAVWIALSIPVAVLVGRWLAGGIDRATTLPQDQS